MGVNCKMMILSFILILVGNNFVKGKRQLLERLCNKSSQKLQEKW